MLLINNNNFVYNFFTLGSICWRANSCISCSRWTRRWNIIFCNSLDEIYNETIFLGEILYVARARHEGALIPGKLVPSHGVTYIPWGGGEHAHSEYEVLCGCSTMWVPVQGEAIPPQAQPAGETEGGEPLFVGRVQHEGSVTIGKVQVCIRN